MVVMVVMRIVVKVEVEGLGWRELTGAMVGYVGGF